MLIIYLHEFSHYLRRQHCLTTIEYNRSISTENSLTIPESIEEERILEKKKRRKEEKKKRRKEEKKKKRKKEKKKRRKEEKRKKKKWRRNEYTT